MFKSNYFEELDECVVKQVWYVYLGSKCLDLFRAIPFKSIGTLSQWQKPSINSEKRKKYRRRKATKLMQKDFELPCLFETSSEGELWSDYNLLTWFVFWVYILKSWLVKSRSNGFCNPCLFHVVAFEWVPKQANKI